MSDPAPRDPPSSGAGRPQLKVIQGFSELTPELVFGGGGGVDPRRLAELPCNDSGNAERLAARHTGRLLWNPAEGWLGWTGTHWSAEEGEALALECARDTAEAVTAEALSLGPDIEQAEAKGEVDRHKWLKARAVELRKWGVASGNLSKCQAMLAMAEGRFCARLPSLDPDKLALNVANGTLRLRLDTTEGRRVPTVTLDAHDPRDRITRIADVAFDAEAEAPLWEQHLETCLPDVEVREFFQAVMGYAAFGETSEQAIFILQGKGGDGKSTTMNVLRRVLGGYADAADIKTFLDQGQRSGADASPDLARLAGDRRLVVATEPPRGSRLNESIIKQITGGSPMVARHLNRDPFEFEPRITLIIECNPRPKVSGSDDGIWRRIVPILWEVQIPKEQMDRGLEGKLFAEREGILNWLLRGAMRWRVEGLRVPAAVQAAADDYRRSSNVFHEWFRERLELDKEALTAAKDFYEDYTAWCADQGYEPMKQAAFGTALGDHQIIVAKKDGRGRKVRRGARIRPSWKIEESMADDPRELDTH